MNLPEDTHLAYIVVHEAWYSQPPNNVRIDNRPTLTVQASAEGGGVAWEFEIVEETTPPGALRVYVFDDAWQAFDQVPEFFFALVGLGGKATLEKVRGALDLLGAVDETDRVGPRH
jgi:hypothetical protein